MRIRPFILALVLLAACNGNKERKAQLLAQKQNDSILAAKEIKISFTKPALRENAKEIMENWPELNRFDGFIQRYFSKKRGDVTQGIPELAQAVDSLYTSKIPTDANLPQIKSRLNLLRNYVYRFQDHLIDENLSDSLFNADIQSIKKAYHSLYIQLNRVNFFKPNPELLDTLE